MTDLITRTPATEQPVLAYPPGSLDGMLATTARLVPDKVAIHGLARPVTYGELDEQATTCAAVLRGLLDEPGSVVALSALLDPAFPATYHGIARSGNVVASVNPLLPEPALAHVLAVSRARVAIVSAEVYQRLRTVRDKLHHLEHVFVVGPGFGDQPALAGEVASWESVLDAQRAAGPATGPAEPVGEDDIGAIVFTSGTTGPPKAVLLSHRNIKVNAAQMARAHYVTGSSVLMAYLPVYHPMHMNTTILRGATQVLCGSHNILDAVSVANRHQVTHFYTLPLVLGWFETHPQFHELEFESVQMIASGASPLAPALVRKLSDQFGVPVFQGYGMCEAAQLTHSDGPVNPKPGSVGPPLVGSETRIVDLDTRAVLPVGEIGEIQVRGPHLMKGYLNRPDVSPFDADRWYSTGDSGYLDADGYLFVLDRVSDVFRCGGLLVSPAEVEAVLAAHPAVRDCAVVDYPDETDGAVPNAYVVLAGGGAEESIDGPAAELTADILAAVNAQLAPHQRIRDVEVVTQIPRSPTNGKVLRKEMRADLVARGA